jgi:nucleoside-diphosphate-sugar epimerase
VARGELLVILGNNLTDEQTEANKKEIDRMFQDNVGKTVAISGCGGFIGNALVRHLLDAGYKVRGMDNFHKGHCDALLGVINHINFEFIYGDVTREDDCAKLVKGADYIVHLAALVGFPACAKQPALAEVVNVEGTRNMVNAANGRPFVFTSTGSVYGAVKDLCTEESPINTNTIYGITKYKAEEIVRKYPNTVIYRYATAFGLSPNMRVNLLVNDFVHRALTEKVLVVFEADFKRTFIHISDFCRSIKFAFNNYKEMQEQKVFNCGSNQLNWTKRQLADYVAEKTGCYVHYADVGKDWDVRNYEVDYSKLNNLGFECVFNMEDGIGELIKATPLLRTRNPYE